MSALRRTEGARFGRFLWLAAVLAVLVAFPPVHFRSTRVADSAGPARVSPRAFAEAFWEKTLPGRRSGAIEATELWRIVEQDPKGASKLGHTSSIGGRPVFLVRGTATVAKLGEQGVVLDLGTHTTGATLLVSGPIFGNQLRDSTGVIRLQDFDSFDFNAISAELNRLAEERVLPDLRKRAVIGARVVFFGAAEIDDASAEHVILRIVPIAVGWP